MYFNDDGDNVDDDDGRRKFILMAKMCIQEVLFFDFDIFDVLFFAWP